MCRSQCKNAFPNTDNAINVFVGPLPRLSKCIRFTHNCSDEQKVSFHWTQTHSSHPQIDFSQFTQFCSEARESEREKSGRKLFAVWFYWFFFRFHEFSSGEWAEKNNTFANVYLATEKFNYFFYLWQVTFNYGRKEFFSFFFFMKCLFADFMIQGVASLFCTSHSPRKHFQASFLSLLCNTAARHKPLCSFFLFMPHNFAQHAKKKEWNDEFAENNAEIFNFFSNHSFSQFHNDSLAAASIQRWLKKAIFKRGNFHECHFSSTMIHFSLCQLNLHRCRHSIMLREMSD